MKIFSSKAIVVYYAIDKGFYWELHFDVDSGIYELNTTTFFENPVLCQTDALNFLKENEINSYEEDWSNLK